MAYIGAPCIAIPARTAPSNTMARNKYARVAEPDSDRELETPLKDDAQRVQSDTDTDYEDTNEPDTGDTGPDNTHATGDTDNTHSPDNTYEGHSTQGGYGYGDGVGYGEGLSAHLPSDLERQHTGGLSARQRALNVVHFLFPVRQTYERLSNGLATGRMQANTPGRFVGQGTDGVFRNLMAKPDTELLRVGQEVHPPTYEEAAADATPEYWETTMISPMYEDEVFVQGLPVGNVANFVWNTLVTVAFQLVGFILCYLLHTLHAAKHGTRAGLGILLIMYGYNIVPANLGRLDRIPPKYEPANPNAFDISKSLSIKTGNRLDTYLLSFKQNLNIANIYTAGKGPYFAYGLIAFGLFIIIKAVVDFYKVKQAEAHILAPQALQQMHSTTEHTETASQ